LKTTKGWLKTTKGRFVGRFQKCKKRIVIKSLLMGAVFIGLPLIVNKIGTLVFSQKPGPLMMDMWDGILGQLHNILYVLVLVPLIFHTLSYYTFTFFGFGMIATFQLIATFWNVQMKEYYGKGTAQLMLPFQVLILVGGLLMPLLGILGIITISD